MLGPRFALDNQCEYNVSDQPQLQELSQNATNTLVLFLFLHIGYLTCGLQLQPRYHIEENT